MKELVIVWVLPGSSDSKESACSMGDPDSIPVSGRCPGGGNGNPLQYSCLENPMDRGTWWIILHGVVKSWTRLSDKHTHSDCLEMGINKNWMPTKCHALIHWKKEYNLKSLKLSFIQRCYWGLYPGKVNFQIVQSSRKEVREEPEYTAGFPEKKKKK